MFEMRRILWAGVGGGLLLLTGCATPFGGGTTCGCPREGLFSRLGFRRSTPVVTEGVVVGTTAGSVPVYTGPSFPGGDCPTCPGPGAGPIYGAPGGGEFIPPGDGPVLPPSSPIPYPYPATPPAGSFPGPGGVFPGTAAPGSTLPPPGVVPGEARPIPAGPSSRRA